MSDETYDVICIGSGVAGLAGAARAAERGASALVLEKADTFGGTTATSLGGLWAGCNHVQRELGIDDDMEDVLAYSRYLAGGYADAARLDRFVTTAPSVLEHFDRLGVSMREIAGVPDHYYPFAPGSIPRGRTLEVVPISRSELGDWADLIEPIDQVPPGVTWTDLVAWGGPANQHRWDAALLAEKASQFGAGQALSARLLKVCLDLGVEVRLSTPAERLLVEGGRVVGVAIGGEGAQQLRATKAVLLAAGGYLGNQTMVEALEDFSQVGNWTPAALTGDGLILGSEIGGMVSKIPLHLARTLGYMVPAEDPSQPPHFDTAGITQLPYPHTIVVNRGGKRFGDESFFESLVPKLHEFDVRTHAPINRPCYMIFDDAFAQRYGFASQPPGTPLPSWLPSADTPGELAEALGIERDAFVETIERFNDGARRGVDEDFGRGSSPWAKSSTGDSTEGNPNLGPIDSPPYYGIELVPSGAGAAGMTADVDGRILHVRGYPIPGLYGAGVVCAVNEYGAGYQAGQSLTSGFTYAYLAIEHALGGG